MENTSAIVAQTPGGGRKEHECLAMAKSPVFSLDDSVPFPQVKDLLANWWDVQSFLGRRFQIPIMVLFPCQHRIGYTELV